MGYFLKIKFLNIFQVQCRSSVLFVLTFSIWEDHKWSAAPIPACLRRGPRGSFHSECCADGDSKAAPHLNWFIAPTIHPLTPSMRLEDVLIISEFLAWHGRESKQAYSFRGTWSTICTLSWHGENYA